MLPAFLTTLFWSYCLIPARQSVAQLGENAANFWRLLAGMAVLGLLALCGGITLNHNVFFWLFISGIIGFGFGDIGVWFALPRIGSRLTLLMVHCIAAPLAGLAEWLWLGTTVGIVQLISLAIILCGIALALAPEREEEKKADHRYGSGILFGLLAAAGQGLGAVCSRKAFSVFDESGISSVSDYIFLGSTSGFIRLTGGILIAGLFWLISRWHTRWRSPPDSLHQNDPLSGKVRNILLCALAGPILGVICYQWALATTPSLIVQLIVSTSPLVILPMAWFIEHDRPSGRSLLGTVVAVLGVVILACF
ncbi:DMT family transporter [Pontiella agarivorans]|uniref:DMT family transporter n=1 Tax=Pontiella agarivorans TaxID=3038953 RepID=A0ABU5MWK7_9BACT|nr:DMT family transporter [Pontiella agarivorans]MDZ8118517.1 DMT family transporter [Pontiella agarivorans]